MGQTLIRHSLFMVTFTGLYAAGVLTRIEISAQDQLADPPKPSVGQLPDPPKPSAGQVPDPSKPSASPLGDPPKPTARQLPDPPKPPVSELPDPPKPPVVERPVPGQPRAVFIQEGLPDVLPVPTVTSGFGIPEGLKSAPEILLPSLGYGPAHSFPLTPSTCFDVGYKCYTYGLYQDALAFANHGLRLSNQARIYLLKAMCEMRLRRSEDAHNTLVKYRHAAVRPEESIGLERAKERLNDPMRVRLESLLSAWNENY